MTPRSHLLQISTNYFASASSHTLLASITSGQIGTRQFGAIWVGPVSSGRARSSAANMSIDFPKEEESVLRRWKEIKAFETQVELSKDRPLYTFYDGPPFAT